MSQAKEKQCNMLRLLIKLGELAVVPLVLE